MTRRALLRAMAGFAAGSMLPVRSSSAVGMISGVSRIEEFSIKGYDRALLPRGHGQLTKLTSPITRRYPSRDHCMQMAAFFSDSSGLLVHTKDRYGYMSDWEIIPGDKLRIHFYGAQPEIEVKSIPPHIEAAAEHYRQWARLQPWATKRQNASAFNLIAVAPNPNMSAQLQSIKKLTEVFPPPMGAWVTQWRKYDFDTMYPDYTPKDPQGFAALLSGLKNLQCAVFPYINALLWDDRLTSFTLRDSAALRTREGDFVGYSPAFPGLKYACPASKAWQGTIIQARKSLLDSEDMLSSGVYLDMLVAERPFLCYASNHGHKPGDPLAWQNGVRKILSSTEGLIMSEGNAETYMDGVDFLLMHLYTDQPDTAPLWKYVYGDLTPSVGWQMPLFLTPGQLSKEIDRAKTFGAASNGSPWMTHTIQESLITSKYYSVLQSLLGSL